MNDAVKKMLSAIVAQIEAGCSPWERSWKLLSPHNPVTKRRYNGSNVLMLWSEMNQNKEYDVSEWATYKQWASTGAQVIKGSKGTPIIYSATHSKEEDGKVKRIPVFKTSFVFNAAQVDGYEPEPKPLITLEESHRAAQAMIDSTGAVIDHSGDQPRFRPLSDTIEIPVIENFTSPNHYYHTLFHELTHWTGHEPRLNRLTFDTKENYAIEELVAEIGASTLYAHFNLPSIESHDASYIASWMKHINTTSKEQAVMKAATWASQAFNFLIPEEVTAERKAA